MAEDLGKTSTGMQANVAALLSYVLGWVTGLIFFLIEKDNKFVRFHAFQSIVTFGGFTVLSIVLTFIPVIGWALIPVVYILELILWILLMVKAYQGEKFKLPIAGEMAEKNA
jgi:uncharacterized membrane protein